jgi:hypothetical protein
VRLVGKRLPEVMPGTLPLSAVEVAFLVAAPFLLEAAWADRAGTVSGGLWCRLVRSCR